MAESAIKRLPERDGEKGEGFPAFVLTKPVDLGKVGVEIAEAMEWDEVPGIMAEGTLSRATPKTPVVVWIMNPDVDATKVRSVVAKHELPLNEWDELVIKAQAGEDLTEEESQKALRMLLLRVR